MKKIMISCVVGLVMASCVDAEYPTTPLSSGEMQTGDLVVKMIHEYDQTKASDNYVTVLEDEKTEHKVEVLVFDKKTGTLSASRTLGSVAEGCSFTMPVGYKHIYVIVNGPDLSSVSTLDQLGQMMDDLSKTTISGDGFVMVGNVECNVTKETVARPLVWVRRLVSRVVLQNITCSIPSQYGKMKVDCVFLGNAWSRQTLSGTVSEMCNRNGYAGQNVTPIGKNGVKGMCKEYFYRDSNVEIPVGESSTVRYHMYCHPNLTDTHTCLYLLTTIGDAQYYYRVPLYNKLKANTTCSVEVDIINIGAALPPDGDIQKGEIVAEIKIAGWTYGDSYSVRF